VVESSQISTNVCARRCPAIYVLNQSLPTNRGAHFCGSHVGPSAMTTPSAARLLMPARVYPVPVPELFETLQVGDQSFQIFRRQIDGRHAASVHFRGWVFEEFGELVR
jgi:hypothetical protein